jgi:hypothetical protein
MSRRRRAWRSCSHLEPTEKAALMIKAQDVESYASIAARGRRGSLTNATEVLERINFGLVHTGNPKLSVSPSAQTRIPRDSLVR